MLRAPRPKQAGAAAANGVKHLCSASAQHAFNGRLQRRSVYLPASAALFEQIDLRADIFRLAQDVGEAQ